MKVLVSALLILFMVSCGSVGEAQLIVAHRGASHDAPENTLAAFRLAWERQADAIEGDFYLTSDGQIVCIHDKTTKRVAPQQPELKVAESTLEELKALDVGSWKSPEFAGECTPTIQEVLGTVPAGRQIFVEIKCGPEIVPVLKQQLTASKLQPEQIAIISFDKDVIRECRRAMPQYRANWLTSYKHNREADVWTPSKTAVVETLKKTEASGLGTNGNLNVIDADFVKAVRDAGCGFHVWTINDALIARRFQTLGADSITTDRPAFIRAALKVAGDGSQ